jgi:DNA-directed RNA polymerase subunit RPC12/RpoP
MRAPVPVVEHVEKGCLSLIRLAEPGARHERTIRIEAANEQQRKVAYVREVAATHAELCPMILRTLGVQDLQRDFSVGDHHYQQICEWETCIVQAKNLESARRYEDAAKVYENLGLWKEAGTVRDKKSARTVKHVTVNINDLIEKVRDGGLTIPYKCRSCGAMITIDSSSNPDGLKFCSYCGSGVDLDSMLDIIKNALK